LEGAINMATKKQSSPKNKETTYINQQMKIFDKKLSDQVKQIHVPVFDVMKKNITIESFFLNHVDYEAIMGKNVKLLDRMVIHIICDFIAERITDDMKNYYFIGIWDKYTIYSVAAATVTFMKHDTKSELYLTAHQYATISQEDLDKLPKGSYMPFSEYNPTRLLQIVSSIMTTVTSTISKIMVEGVPHALISPEGKSSTVPTFIFQRFYNKIKDSNITLPCGVNDETTEKNIMKFSDAIETPIMEHISVELKEAGLSDNIINLFIGASNLHIIYEIPENKKMSGVTYLFNMESKDDRFAPIKVGYTVSVKDIVTIINSKDISEIAKTRIKTMGTDLRNMIMHFTTAAVSLYVSTMAANAEVKSK
jgi:hypothetical protein